jgi:hypothetical protein
MILIKKFVFDGNRYKIYQDNNNYYIKNTQKFLNTRETKMLIKQINSVIKSNQTGGVIRDTNTVHDGMKIDNVTVRMEESCPICDAKYAELEHINIPLTCGHVTCETCAMEILRRNRKCPICRADYNLAEYPNFNPYQPVAPVPDNSLIQQQFREAIENCDRVAIRNLVLIQNHSIEMNLGMDHINPHGTPFLYAVKMNKLCTVKFLKNARNLPIVNIQAKIRQSGWNALHIAIGYVINTAYEYLDNIHYSTINVPDTEVEELQELEKAVKMIKYLVKIGVSKTDRGYGKTPYETIDSYYNELYYGDPEDSEGEDGDSQTYLGKFQREATTESIEKILKIFRKIKELLDTRRRSNRISRSSRSTRR